MGSKKPDNNDILYDLCLCLESELPIPVRVSAAFIDLVGRGFDGAFHSWDEAFGKPPMNLKAREVQAAQGGNPARCG